MAVRLSELHVLVTGATGYVGRALVRTLRERGVRVTATSRSPQRDDVLACDLSDARACTELARRVGSVTAIVHLAGSKDVASLEADPALARRLNAEPVAHLRRAFGASPHFVFASTDFVFSGWDGPYGEQARPSPDTEYGRSKRLAERFLRRCWPRSTVVRFAAAYDLEAAFPKRLLDELGRGRDVECFSDARYTPVYLPDLCAGLASVLEHEPLGVLHLAGETTDRCTFARVFARELGLDPSRVVPTNAPGASPLFRPDRSLALGRAGPLCGFAPRSVQEAARDMSARRESRHP
jgi:dTDP-4-dehydrorhamnose reductase